MGYIEELAAREAARQKVNAAKQAEMARVMNQGQVGLAATVAEPYVSGISQEDAYKLALARQAALNNYNKDVATMRGATVTNGQIAPEYWSAAQRASDYERGLAGRQGR